MMDNDTIDVADVEPEGIKVDPGTVLRILQVKAGADPLLRAQLEAAVWEAAYLSKN